jgi:hypothetical protein
MKYFYIHPSIRPYVSLSVSVRRLPNSHLIGLPVHSDTILLKVYAQNSSPKYALKYGDRIIIIYLFYIVGISIEW